MTKYTNSIGVKVPALLLPRPGVDMTKWAVVACDQYTSQPAYWQETESIVGDAPSTLRIMLPELYLDGPDEAERIASINAHMKEYMDTGILENKGEGFAYVRRTVDGKTRQGLIVALDLEDYDYSKGSTTLIRAVVDNAKNIPGFFTFFGITSPSVDANGIQQVANGAPVFGEAGSYGFLTIISTLSWGLGYFGMPQVLLRFMAIRKTDELVRARRIATVWVVISLTAAVLIGLMGRAMFPVHETLNTASGAENVFIVLSRHLLPPLLAGLVMAGILAATISSSDSYLLIAASAVSLNIFKGILKKDASDKQVMTMSRIILLLIAVVGVIIAMDENSVIFTIVSFAWAGFGAVFGPIMLFSLFWKRTTQAGAVAGMVTGGVMVFLWKLALKPLGGVFGIYELFPAFVLSCLVILVVSLLTPAPSAQIQQEFDLARNPQA